MQKMVAGRLDTNLIWKCMRKGGGGGSGHFTRGNQEGIWRRYLEGGEGASDHVGKSNVAGNTDRSRILYITK